MTVKRRRLSYSLNYQADRSFVQRLISTGNAFDVNKGGYYDARSGCVNLWVGPEDKPECWQTPITQGGLKYARSYAGTLRWEWTEDEKADLLVEAEPYDLLENRHGRPQPLSNPEWDEILAWCVNKAKELIRLTELAPKVIGTKCPCCDFVLPTGHLLNVLLEHLTDVHGVHVTSFTLGENCIVVTDRGEFTLETVEAF